MYRSEVGLIVSLTGTSIWMRTALIVNLSELTRWDRKFVGPISRARTRPVVSQRKSLRWLVALLMALLISALPIAHVSAGMLASEMAATAVVDHDHHHESSGHTHDDDWHDDDRHDDDRLAAWSWPPGHGLGHEHDHKHGNFDHVHDTAAAFAVTPLRCAPVPLKEWRMQGPERAAYDLITGLERPPRAS